MPENEYNYSDTTYWDDDDFFTNEQPQIKIAGSPYDDKFALTYSRSIKEMEYND